MRPSIPPSPADLAKLISRVEELERRFRNIGFAGTDGIPETSLPLSSAKVFANGSVPSTGLASDTDHVFDLDDLRVNYGDDVTIDTIGGIHFPFVTKPGIYALSYFASFRSENNNDTFAMVQMTASYDAIDEGAEIDTAFLEDIRFPGRVPVGGGNYQSLAEAVIPWVGYLAAGARLETQIIAYGGGAATWQAASAIYIARIR